MALSIKHPEADRLARELARRQGKSLTEAVIDALEAELVRERLRVRPSGTDTRLLESGSRFVGLPILDTRSDDDILGYDSHGGYDGSPG